MAGNTMLRNDLDAECRGCPMRSSEMASKLRLACAAIVILTLNACAGSYITAPDPAGYVRVLPLPEHGTLRDILVRNGRPVGEPDPTAPGDPTVRILHGQPFQAKEFFDTLSKGGTPVPSAIGKAFRLPDGAILVYVEHDVSSASSTSIGSVTIFVLADGIPVSQLRFYVPPSTVGACFGGCEGGGGM
jgi:hypothetical protein